MNKILSFLYLTGILSVGAQAVPKLYVLDQISAVISPGDVPTLGSKEERSKPNLPIVITQQEVVQRGYDGQKHSLEDLIEENALFQKSELMKMSLSDEEVDRQLEKMGMTKEQEVELAEKWNFADVADFKVSLKKMYVASNALTYDTEVALTIPDQDILDYYNQHPVEQLAEYEFQTSFMAGDTAPTLTVQQRNSLDWSEVIVVPDDQISEQNDFLKKLQPGQIHVKAVVGGFDLFKLTKFTPQHLKPLIERKSEITGILRQERYPQVVSSVKKDVMAMSNVFYPEQYSDHSLA